MSIPAFWRWTMGIVIVLMMIVVPSIHYRRTYRFAKRLRTVDEGKLYRSGCLMADGLRAAIKDKKIKTVINLQDESPDPAVPTHYFTLGTTLESEVCRAMGVKFIFMPVELVNSREFPRKHAPTVETFLKIMDDPANCPVLIHCRAGLHRTGVLAALYREEYDHWSPAQALRELKNHGFGEFVSSSANPYIVQYVLQYQPRWQNADRHSYQQTSFQPSSEAISHPPTVDRRARLTGKVPRKALVMLTLMDRQLIASYLKAYLICLISMIGLFIVVDLFTNLDNFTDGKESFEQVMRNIATYYGMKTMQIFDRLCEAIVLLAAMFTIALLQRNNELLPMLSAGVSIRRVVRPVLLSAFLMLGLSILNQEFVLPHVDSYMAETKDFKGDRETTVQGGYEPNGVHISGRTAIKKDMTVHGFTCVFPPQLGRDNLTTLQAKEARYIPEKEGWLLTGTVPPEIPQLGQNVDMKTPGTYFLHTSDVDFESMIRPRGWYTYCSTFNLLRELAKAHSSQVAGVAVVFHMRLTRPVLGMLLVFMGLSIILRDQNRNIFFSTGLCVALCALFFITVFLCKHLGDNEYISPALAAWFPVVLFGPLSFVMFDAVHT